MEQQERYQDVENEVITFEVTDILTRHSHQHDDEAEWES